MLSRWPVSEYVHPVNCKRRWQARAWLDSDQICIVIVTRRAGPTSDHRSHTLMWAVLWAQWRSNTTAHPVRADLTRSVVVGCLWIISGSDLTRGCWRWSVRPVIVWRHASLCWSDAGLERRSLDQRVQSFIKLKRRSKPAIGDRRPKFKAGTRGASDRRFWSSRRQWGEEPDDSISWGAPI
jgi:hypothetical protein